MNNNQLLNALSEYDSSKNVVIRTYNQYGIEMIVPIFKIELNSENICLTPSIFNNSK